MTVNFIWRLFRLQLRFVIVRRWFHFECGEVLEKLSFHALVMLVWPVTSHEHIQDLWNFVIQGVVVMIPRYELVKDGINYLHPPHVLSVCLKPSWTLNFQVLRQFLLFLL
jgi:hypothetical protein